MWHPHDGAIVELVLHLHMDPGLRWDVDIFIDVSPTEARTPIR